MIKTIHELQQELNRQGSISVDGLFGQETLSILIKALFLKHIDVNQLSSELIEHIRNRGYDILNANKIFMTEQNTENSPIPSVPFKLNQLVGWMPRKKSRIQQIILHHDLTVSPETTFLVLNEKNLSSHGVINYSGVFVQFLSFDKIAYHASGHILKNNKIVTASFNKNSIGIDINNPFYPALRKGVHQFRPLLQNPKKSSLFPEEKFLGLYSDQVVNTISLLGFLCNYYSISIFTSEKEYEWDPTITPTTPGFFAHHHVSRNREFDPFDFDFKFARDELNKK